MPESMLNFTSDGSSIGLHSDSDEGVSLGVIEFLLIVMAFVLVGILLLFAIHRTRKGNQVHVESTGTSLHRSTASDSDGKMHSLRENADHCSIIDPWASDITDSKIQNGVIIEQWGGGHVDEPSLCVLCSKPLQIGEEICNSYNPDCPHIHHKECITNWLHLQNTCPTCNKIYMIEQV